MFTTIRCALAGALLVSAAPASSADVPDAARGRLLYENHCVVCHTAKVHRRNPPLAIDRAELRRIVADWSREAKAQWGAAEIEDVVQYLETTYYRQRR